MVSTRTFLHHMSFNKCDLKPIDLLKLFKYNWPCVDDKKLVIVLSKMHSKMSITYVDVACSKKPTSREESKWSLN